jgi:predicted nucleic acid-binding protein
VSQLLLIDTNVIVAAVAEAHEHHGPSLALFSAGLPLAVAAHSHAEAFTTLTRRGDHAPFRWTAAEAWGALESVAAVTRLMGLSPAQTLAAVRDFANAGHVGARIYDHLIARAAEAAGATRLVSWNVGHMRGLVAGLDVCTPATLLASPP